MVYSDEIADKICERIANGESVNSFAGTKGMPAQSTIYKWLIENKDFSEKYTRARETQAEVHLDEIIEIADNCTDDVEKIMTQHGEDYRINQSAIARARLQIDARKWTMSKLAPKKYGDKTSTTISGDKENPLAVAVSVIERIIKTPDETKI